MKKYIVVEADTNDGDYITEKSLISDEKIEQLKVALAKLGNQNGIPWNTGDMVNEKRGRLSPDTMYGEILTKQELDLIEEFVPHGEYGVHTIESMEILEVIKEYKL